MSDTNAESVMGWIECSKRWKSRAEAAEARVAELEKALRKISDYEVGAETMFAPTNWQTYQAIANECRAIARAALQREPLDPPQPMTLCDSGGGSALFRKMAEHHQAAMRERAAKLVMERLSDGWDHGHRTFAGHIAACIRALPLTNPEES